MGWLGCPSWGEELKSGPRERELGAAFDGQRVNDWTRNDADKEHRQFDNVWRSANFL